MPAPLPRKHPMRGNARLGEGGKDGGGPRGGGEGGRGIAVCGGGQMDLFKRKSKSVANSGAHNKDDRSTIDVMERGAVANMV